MFRSAGDSALEEIENRRGLFTKLLGFGVKYLDDACLGISPNDLILVGAPAGTGKTQFCCNLAFQNIQKGKRVHYIALEADKYEIERRIKWQILSRLFYSDPNRPRISEHLRYSKWALGLFLDELKHYEEIAASEFAENYKNLFLYQSSDQFTVDDLIRSVLSVAHETDLIMVDHVHYFDFDDDNENRAIKDLAKVARSLALKQNIPLLLVAHLRKKDRGNTSLVADYEEFHGSSDLYKIATKVITFSSGPQVAGTGDKYATFFRIPKNRVDGSVTRFIASVAFSLETATYADTYRLCHSSANKFEELDTSLYPRWAQRPIVLAGSGGSSSWRPPGADKD